MTKIKENLTVTITGQDAELQELSFITGWNGIVVLEDSLSIFYKAKYTLTIQL